MTTGYIGVDFDGTLAHHLPDGGVDGVGEPIPAMVERVRAWVANGVEVRIITARYRVVPIAAGTHAVIRWNHTQTEMIHAFLQAQNLPRLTIQAHKCFRLLALYDDRAVAVERGTGRLLSPEPGV